MTAAVIGPERLRLLRLGRRRDRLPAPGGGPDDSDLHPLRNRSRAIATTPIRCQRSTSGLQIGTTGCYISSGSNARPTLPGPRDRPGDQRGQPAGVCPVPSGSIFRRCGAPRAPARPLGRGRRQNNGGGRSRMSFLISSIEAIEVRQRPVRPTDRKQAYDKDSGQDRAAVG